MSEVEERRRELEAELAALGSEEAQIASELDQLPAGQAPVITVKSPGKVK